MQTFQPKEHCCWIASILSEPSQTIAGSNHRVGLVGPKWLIFVIRFRWNAQLQNCIAEAAEWCGARRLQLNASKTDLLWYGPSTALQSLSSSEKDVGDATIVSADAAIRHLRCSLTVSWACLLTLPRQHRHASSTFDVYDRFVVYLEVMLLQNSSLHLSSRSWTIAML